jgi:hypothetical protein
LAYRAAAGNATGNGIFVAPESAVLNMFKVQNAGLTMKLGVCFMLTYVKHENAS